MRESATWARLLHGVAVALVVVVTLVMALAVVAVVADERDHADAWDGFGTFIGLIALAVGAVHLVVLGVVVALLRVGRRQASRPHVVAAALVALVLGGAWIAWGVGLAGEGWHDASSVLLTAVPGIVLALPAGLTLLDRD